jgi:hypothetical protein
MRLRSILFSLVAPFVILTLAPAAVSTVAGAADLCRDIALQCDGFEPNWQLTLGMDSEGDQVVSFIDPENPDWQSDPLIVAACAFQDSASHIFFVTPAPLELNARVRSETCVEPNDEVRPFAVEVRFNQGAQTGNARRISGSGCCKLAP